jgi:hypothetical protein
MTGSLTETGACAPMSGVAFEAAVAEPSALVAVTLTRSRNPTSALDTM